jgi:transcriptional regulator with XRE-family HTH domain
VAPDQFRAAIAALGWNQREAAEALMVELRTVQHWCAGTRAIPGPAIVALGCMRRLRACGCGDAQEEVAEG